MSTLPTPGVYTVDPLHSNVDFVARHLVASKVRGNFTEFDGTITIGDSIENSSVEATVQAASITTGNEMRDGHLKSADFLEQEKYPTLTFKSTKITSKGGDDYELVADLTIQGSPSPSPSTLSTWAPVPRCSPASRSWALKPRAEFDRRDFNVNFDGALENGSLVVGNKVVIQLTVEASRRPRRPPKTSASYEQDAGGRPRRFALYDGTVADERKRQGREVEYRRPRRAGDDHLGVVVRASSASQKGRVLNLLTG